MLTKRTMALVNPKAGTHHAQAEYLRVANERGSVVRTVHDPQDLQGAIEQAKRESIDRLIVVGGDGSVSHALNALSQNLQQFEIAVVPAGTGNDLARSLGIPIDDLATAWEIAFNGVAASIDAVKLRSTGHIFINSVTVGFGNKEVADVDRDKKSYFGKLAYWLTALAKMGDMPTYDISIEADGHLQRLDAFGLWISNGRYVGGGFSVAPSAMLDDGLLDVMIVPASGTMELLSAGVDYATIGPEDSEQFVTLRASAVRLNATPPTTLSIDGEASESNELTCEVLPHAARLVVGPMMPAISGQSP